MYDFEFPIPAFTTFTMIRQAWIAMNKACETELGKVSLTPEMTAVLWLCRDYPGTLIPAEIARMLFRENQTIAGLLNRMEKDGLVQRVPKRKGHPFTEVKITTKGKELCDKAVPKLQALITDFGADLSLEQHKHLQNLTKKMRDRALQRLYIEPGAPSDLAPGVVPVKW